MKKVLTFYTQGLGYMAEQGKPAPFFTLPAGKFIISFYGTLLPLKITHVMVATAENFLIFAATRVKSTESQQDETQKNPPSNKA